MNRSLYLNVDGLFFASQASTEVQEFRSRD